MPEIMVKLHPLATTPRPIETVQPGVAAVPIDTPLVLHLVEKGMQSGAPSVIIELPGTAIETSLNALVDAMSAMIGARGRWER